MGKLLNIQIILKGKKNKLFEDVFIIFFYLLFLKILFFFIFYLVYLFKLIFFKFYV